MQTDHKKPGVAFWATVVLVVVLGYPLSYGPFCWMGHRGWIPASANVAYHPLYLVFNIGQRNRAIDRLFDDYIWWWIDLAMD